jgi:hypothetical protein
MTVLQLRARFIGAVRFLETQPITVCIIIGSNQSFRFFQIGHLCRCVWVHGRHKTVEAPRELYASIRVGDKLFVEL